MLNEYVLNDEEYLNLFNLLSDKIKEYENLESMKKIRKMYVNAKKFLYDFVLPFMVNYTVTDDIITYSYDLVNGNKEIGTYALVVEFNALNEKVYLKTTIYNKTEEKIYNFNLEDDMNKLNRHVKAVQKNCLLNNYKSFLISTKIGKNQINEKTLEIIELFNEKIKNKYIQYIKKGSIIEVYISPKTAEKEESIVQFIDNTNLNDNSEYLCNIKINNKNYTISDLNKGKEEIDKIISDLRREKILLYSYNINYIKGKDYFHSSN